VGILEKLLATAKDKGLAQQDVDIGDTIELHQRVLHKCWAGLLPGVDTKTLKEWRKKAEDAADDVLRKYGILLEKKNEGKKEWEGVHDKMALDKLSWRIEGYVKKADEKEVTITKRYKKEWTDCFLEEKLITEKQLQSMGWYTATAKTMRDEWIAAAEEVIQAALSQLSPPPAGVSAKSFDTLVTEGAITFTGNTVKNAMTKQGKTKASSIHAMGSNYSGHGPTISLGRNVFHAHIGNGDGLAFSWNNSNLVICGVGKKDGNTIKGTSGYTWTT
jgi:hypothetical protein